MEILKFFLHLDEHLGNLINNFGIFSYVLLFAVIFVETGFVVIPFLPGDSVLFVVGSLAGSGFLNIWIVYFTLLAAAILGDTVNYWIGHHLGPRVFSKENSRFFNKAYLLRTHEFYQKHGGKAIILARFIPIIRTFAPFVAGVGKMNYRTFLSFNIIGAFIWVSGITFAGYFFGGLPFIRKNFDYLIFGIIIISFLPILIEYIKHKKETKISKEKLAKETYKDIEKTFKEEHLND